MGMTRLERVAAVLVGVVMLAGLAGCGDDDGGDVAAGGGSDTSTTASTTDGEGTGGVRPAPQEGPPSLVGPITQVSAREQTQECDESDPDASPDDVVSSDDEPSGCGKSGVLGTFLVEDGVDPDGRALAASVKVPPDIAILREDGQGGWALASFDDLAVGQTVQVWFDGPVAESYPVQATAGSIVIEA
jgi:hypothetical protein